MVGYLLVTLMLVAFCLMAQRLSRTVVTAPMLFLGFGLLLSQTGLMPEVASAEALHVVAEVTLVILLFLDAAQIDVTALRHRFSWPARMLLIGLPLSVLIGTGAGLIWMPDVPLVALALLATILAPTDAALGQPVVSNPAVPERPRRALIVESGLNDGLALPVIFMLAVAAAPAIMAPPEGWALYGLKQVTLGPLTGIALGFAGGKAMLWAQARGYTADIYEGIAALALAASAYIAADLVGGNGFIAAFTAGLAFGALTQGRCGFVYEFTESEGQLLSWASFLLMGLVLLPEAITHLTWPMAALILTSLLVVRPLAIWLSLSGSDADPLTRVFFGWFGPRGLATALFALLIVEQLDPELHHLILHTAVNAVWISAVLHGITAGPAARIYGRIMEARQAQSASERPG